MKELFVIALLIFGCGNRTLNDSTDNEIKKKDCLTETVGSESGIHAKHYSNCDKSDTIYVYNGGKLILQAPFVSPENDLFRKEGFITFSNKQKKEHKDILEEGAFAMFPLVDANDRSMVFGINSSTGEKLYVKNSKNSLSSKGHIIYYNFELKHLYILQANNVDHIPVNIYTIESGEFKLVKSVNVPGLEISQDDFIEQLLLLDQ